MSYSEQDDPVRRELAGLRREPLDGEFARRLHVRLASAPPPDAPGLFVRVREWLADRPMAVGAAAGASATAMGGLLLFSWFGAPGAGAGSASIAATAPAPTSAATAPSQPPADVFVVPQGRVAIVQFHLDSDVAIPDARVRIDLPEGLSFYDRGPEERGFVLVTELAPGETPIPLAVHALEPGRHVIRATARIDGVIVRHRVVLEVEGGAG